MNTLEKFDDVADVIVRGYRSDPRESELKELFEGYKVLIANLFELTKYIKSQEKRNVDDLVKHLVRFLVKYEELFPGESCYNKLHFVMWHLVEFVAEWETCGRLSAESHESMHTAFEKAKSAACKMASTNQRYTTIFARMTFDLKNGIAELKRTIAKKMNGKKRGPYATKKSNKRQDEVDFVREVFSKTSSYGGEEFIELPCDGGRIPKKYIDEFAYVVTGRSPSSWIKGFAESRLLSDVKLEEARYATFNRL